MSSGSPTRNGTSVEPGLEKSVVSPSSRSAASVASRTVRGAGSRRDYRQNHLVFAWARSYDSRLMSSTSPKSPRFATTRFDASEQIALEIRRYLEREGLQPGDRIGTEQQLATEFGVSRPTLREALRLLAGSHLIRVTRGRSGGHLRRPHARRRMSRNLSESIATMLATESVSVLELLEARMFIEVPLAPWRPRPYDAGHERAVTGSSAEAIAARLSALMGPPRSVVSKTPCGGGRAIPRALGCEAVERERPAADPLQRATGRGTSGSNSLAGGWSAAALEPGGLVARTVSRRDQRTQCGVRTAMPAGAARRRGATCGTFTA